MEGIAPLKTAGLRYLAWGTAAFCLIWTTSAFAADKEHLAMLAAAQVAFDRVEAEISPPLADATACVQAQAAMISVALPAEETDLHYRKGYCELAVGALTHSQATFADAAAELDRGGAAMLAWLSRRAGNLPEDATWKEPDTCPKSCERLAPAAKVWKGWIALHAGDPYTAAALFDAEPDSGWPAYAAGYLAFRGGRYAESVRRYREALDAWTRAQQSKDLPLTEKLDPPENILELLSDLGGAQIVAGDAAGAIATLDRSLDGAPNARAYFLRARAKELTGQAEGALADYNLASRVAFADAKDLKSGEAHLYRGILLYRRKDYKRAEEEFTSALNFDINATLRPDASAWRHLAAVASGACGASREYLERALGSVSPYFPKAEAQAAAAGCRAGP